MSETLQRAASVPSIIGGAFRRLGGVPTAGFPIGGPATRALLTTALASGIGYLGGRYVLPLFKPVEDPRAAGAVGATLGGIASLAAHSPLLWDQYKQHGLAGINSTPKSRAKLSRYAWESDPLVSGENTRQMIAQSSGLSFPQRMALMRAVPDRPPGIIRASDIGRGLAGAMLGGLGGATVGVVLSPILGLSMSGRRRMAAGGAVAGALYNAGIFRR